MIALLVPVTIISFFKISNEVVNEPPKEQIGEVKVVNNNNVINTSLNDYLIGVVAGEMPALFEPEALKAQAVAARTYLYYHLQNHETITGTINDQVYITEEEMKEKWQDKYEEYYDKIKNAVLSTENKVMTYQGKPIKAYYYSRSNGYTESSLNVFNEENDYLKVVESNFEDNGLTTITIPKKEFCDKLSISCDTLTIKDEMRNESNRISTITINEKIFKGTEVRQLLGLRSTDFTLEILEQDINITTKGYGHGVGMSQYGANSLAKEGYKYEDILNYYYQNIEIDDF